MARSKSKKRLTNRKVKKSVAVVIPPAQQTQKTFDNLRAQVLKSRLDFNEDENQYSDGFVPESNLTPHSVHTTAELVGLLEKDKSIEIDAKVIELGPNKQFQMKTIRGRENFLKEFKAADKKWNDGIKKYQESNDSFLTDADGVSSMVGNDFLPILGGPFYKQLYQYDYLRMIAAAYYAFHHDPIAKRTVNIIKDFVLGRGFKVDSKDKTALALWDAFYKVNDMYQMLEWLVTEIEVYGEVMIWKLPDHATKIGYQLLPGQEPPKGIIPRIRLIDPSAIWEIVTYPEDITRKLYYQYIAPTQYQTYTAPGVPTTKFIFQQIPADQVMHYKLNSVSNEKRGRSELFASLGYLKRLRDSVNYSIVGLQKAAAWSIDTTVEGNTADMNAYAESQKSLGTIPSAGSEFIHTSKVKREYLGNTASSRGGNSNSFEWALSMICAGNGIPVSWYGTHLSGGQTRASALVATEPVAKLMESRQLLVERIVRDLFTWLTKADCEVTFPEIITQDSSQKLKNIGFADQAGYISKKRAANMATKELNVTEFDFDQEIQEIKKYDSMEPEGQNPLSAPGAAGIGASGASSAQAPRKPSAVTGQDRAKVKATDGY